MGRALFPNWRLACALIASLLLHAALLYARHSAHSDTPTIDSAHREELVATLRAPAEHARNMGSLPDSRSTSPERSTVAPPQTVAHSRPRIEKINPVSLANALANAQSGNSPVERPAPSTRDAPLDLDRILEQAREYAITEMPASSPSLDMTGDYFGTYSGADTGTFAISIDRTGRVSGSGQSTATSAFYVSGRVDANGALLMSSNGSAGGARFSGRLNLRTGQISGTWQAGGDWRGQFTGQQERSASLNNPLGR